MQWFGPFVNFSTTQKIATIKCFQLASVSSIQSKSFTFFRPFCQPVNKQNSTIASVLQSYYPFGFIFVPPSARRCVASQKIREISHTFRTFFKVLTNFNACLNASAWCWSRQDIIQSVLRSRRYGKIYNIAPTAL